MRKGTIYLRTMGTMLLIWLCLVLLFAGFLTVQQKDKNEATVLAAAQRLVTVGTEPLALSTEELRFYEDTGCAFAIYRNGNDLYYLMGDLWTGHYEGAVGSGWAYLTASQWFTPAQWWEMESADSANVAVTAYLQGELLYPSEGAGLPPVDVKKIWRVNRFSDEADELRRFVAQENILIQQAGDFTHSTSGVFRCTSYVVLKKTDTFSNYNYYYLVAGQFSPFAQFLNTLLLVSLVCLAVFVLTGLLLSQSQWGQLKQQREQIRHRQDLTGALAHDLKTPLAAISGYAEILTLPQTEEKQQHYAQRIDANVTRMNTLLEQMLTLNGLEQTCQLHLEVLNLRQEVGACLEEVSAAESKLRLTVEGDGEIKADRQLLHLALNNLLANALRYTPADGQVKIILTSQSITIRNTVTHPLTEPERIWEAFYREDKARSVSGTGLGLTITAEIFRRHGFSYRAENGEDTVSIFITF